MAVGLEQRAEQIAREAHAGQKYAGKDFANNHLLPVVTLLRYHGYDERHRVAGWLHDTLEDTALTAADLLAEDIPPEVVHAIELVSKVEGQPHGDYIAAIKKSPMAIAVKFFDSTFNFSTTVANMPALLESRPGKVEEWMREYPYNLEQLQPVLPKPCDGRSLASVALMTLA